MTGFAPLPSVDLSSAATLFEPPGDGEGHWVGAPCAHRHDGTTYLAVRWRDPERRGYEVVVYERTGRDDFAERVRITSEQLGVRSVERAALCTDPYSGELRCYLPVDHGENDWTIQALDAVAEPAQLDPATARDVLVPAAGTSDAETVKDPYVVTVGGRYYMFYAGHDGVSEQAHLATSADGEAWERSPANPVVPRSDWHDYHTRVTCVHSAPDAPVWTLYYDGSGTDDYDARANLRTGVAVASELSAPVDTTMAAPALSAPVADGDRDLDRLRTCRYVDVLDDPVGSDGSDGPDGPELFAEVARPDGAFELRRVDLPVR